MFSRLQWVLLKLSRQTWLRASAFSVLGVLTALIAVLLKRYIPADLPTKVGADAVESLLGIIATSMLSVTIFSLSTMVSAYSSATSNVTPRATRLLLADTTAQNSLATFVGSFLFSLVGLIVLRTGLYGASGRVVLYVVTLFVIVVIVVTLLRWIDYVLSLGRVGPTSRRVEEAVGTAMRLRGEAPFLGGRPRSATDEPPAGGLEVHARRIGYVEHVDMEALQQAAETSSLEIHVMALPGTFVSDAQPLVSIVGDPKDGCVEAIVRAFDVDGERSFEQDPRFGACVLSEIASRALSPAVNDPGTAIDILSRGAHVLSIWAEPAKPEAEVIRFGRVHVPALRIEDLFDDFFHAIARDGAAIVEVGIHLQKVLQALAAAGDARYVQAALRQSAHALERAETALVVEVDRQRVRAAAARVGMSPPSASRTA